MLDGIFKAIDSTGLVAGAASAVMIALIAVFILAEVFSRSAFNYSLSFAWEYSSYCMASAFFCGAAFTLHTGGHVRVSLVSHAVPRPVARAIDGLATLLAIVIAAYLTKAMIELTAGSIADGSRSVTSEATPLAIPQAAMAFGTVLLLLQLIARLLRLLTGREPELAGAANDYTMDQ